MTQKEKRNTKPTKTQLEKTALKEIIFNYLVKIGTARNIKEIQADIPEISEISNPHINVVYLMTKLVDSGKVIKKCINYTPYYSAALNQKNLY